MSTLASPTFVVTAPISYAHTEVGGVVMLAYSEGALNLFLSSLLTTREEIADVFAELALADQRQARKAGGVGLRLTTSEKLVCAMGGCLRVTREVGRGSTFAFRLPTTVAEGATAWPTTNAGKVSAVVAHTGVSTRRALGRYLVRAVYKVEADGDDLALVLGTAASLQALDRPGVPAIRLDGSGSGALDQVGRDGGDQAVMI